MKGEKVKSYSTLSGMKKQPEQVGFNPRSSQFTDSIYNEEQKYAENTAVIRNTKNINIRE